MANEVKSFLSSPMSLEAIEPVKKRAKRKERPSKCILSKSIYEETDLSKLTPRQRVLHQRYQESKNNVTSFFLLSNNISIQKHSDDKPKEDEKENVSDGEFPRENTSEPNCREYKVDAQNENRFLVVTSDLYSNSCDGTREESISSEDDGKIIEAMDVESPFDNELHENAIYKGCLICKECFRDAIRIYCTLEKISSMHKCSYQNSIILHKYKIRQNFKKQLCFSAIRKEEVMFVKALVQLRCCNSKA
ncbi:hypothetical protein KMI_01g00090 [Encephalitozoon hellem]|nr:hypothetical protein KMI_01g00090 [Encephalitozoon hellem]